MDWIQIFKTGIVLAGINNGIMIVFEALPENLPFQTYRWTHQLARFSGR